MGMQEQRDKDGKFKKGHKFGRGRPALSPEDRELMQMTTAQSIKLINKWLWSTSSEIEEAKKDPNITIFDLAIIRILEKAMTGKSIAPIRFLTDRILGKIK